MSRHHFQLTYSIKHYKETEKSFAMAKQVRDKIARTDFPGWSKIENVETTFKGLLTLYKMTNSEKREEAEALVKNAFSEIMSELDATFEVWAHCSLMVGDLGESIEFSF